MTSSANKPGRKGKGGIYRMMRVRVDTWNRLATYTAERNADPCDAHGENLLESPDYCQHCDLRLDRAILALLRQPEPGPEPLPDGPIARHHRKAGNIIQRVQKPVDHSGLKSQAAAAQAGHCVGICGGDTEGAGVARCYRCKHIVRTDTAYCPCCGDQILDRPPDQITGASIRRGKESRADTVDGHSKTYQEFTETHDRETHAKGKSNTRTGNRMRKRRSWK